MNTALLIYLYFTIGNIIPLLLVPSAVVGVACLFIILVCADAGDPAPDKVWRLFKPSLVVFILGLLVATFYPSKETIKWMIGGTAVVEASKLGGIERLPQNVIDLANEFLEATTEEVREGE